jgi:hypothetical protein
MKRSVAAAIVFLAACGKNDPAPAPAPTAPIASAASTTSAPSPPAVSTAAAASTAAPAPASAAVVSVDLAVKIVNKKVAIEGVVKNVSPAVIDTKVVDSKLLVDGKPLESWPLAIGNGPRDGREFKLSPGDKVEFSRHFEPKDIAPPGKHTFVLVVRDVRSAQVDLATP